MSKNWKGRDSLNGKRPRKHKRKPHRPKRGRSDGRWYSGVVGVTEDGKAGKVHHFFAMDATTFDFLLQDEQGRVAVYLDRAACLAAAIKANPTGVVMACGMGDEKWALFQKEVPFRLIGERGSE
jgi:hypothetical protein